MYISGAMWEWDHIRILHWNEYIYWTYHILPFGWGIIREPMLED